MRRWTAASGAAAAALDDGLEQEPLPLRRGGDARAWPRVARGGGIGGFFHQEDGGGEHPVVGALEGLAQPRQASGPRAAATTAAMGSGLSGIRGKVGQGLLRFGRVDPGRRARRAVASPAAAAWASAGTARGRFSGRIVPRPWRERGDWGGRSPRAGRRRPWARAGGRSRRWRAVPPRVGPGRVAGPAPRRRRPPGEASRGR
jgi:hypothetical protein